MSNLILKNIADSIRLIPIRSIQINEPDEDRWTIIDQLEAESSYRIVPITKNNQYGNSVILYSNIEITCYVPHNDYVNNGLIERLDEINLATNQMHLKTGEIDDFLYTPSKTINYTNKQKIILPNIRIAYEIESVEYRPRMILRIRKTLKQSEIKDIFY